MKRFKAGSSPRLSRIAAALALAGMAAVPFAALAASNSNCPEESVFYDPGNGEDIVVPKGFKVEVFAKGLNFPTDIAFVGGKDDFKVYVLESGTGLPGKCNNNVGVYGGPLAANNPFTPDILIFDNDGRRIGGPLGKPTSGGGGFQSDGPAIGLSFEHNFEGGTLYATDSNQGVRGARPTNNSPDRLAIARQNPDGTPEYHGWPDRFGFLDSTQSVFNPKGSGGDDNSAATAGKPVLPVFAFFPQPPVAPIALEPSDVAAVGLDFVPNSFIGGVVKKNAVLVSREGDFGFSQENGDPSAGHDVELVNFKSQNPSEVQLSRFAFNCKQSDQRHDPDGTPKCAGESDQAFTSRVRGINRPTTIRFGPDGAAYLVDYGAVRDPGGADSRSRFVNPANAPLVQLPGTGTIWRISRSNEGGDDD